MDRRTTTERVAATAGPIIGVRTYVVVCVALLVLTLATSLIGRVHLGVWNLPVALVIAVGKSLLVALYFMHLRVSGARDRLALAAGVLWLSILLLGAMDDYLTRAWLRVVGR